MNGTRGNHVKQNSNRKKSIMHLLIKNESTKQTVQQWKRDWGGWHKDKSQLLRSMDLIKVP